MTIAITGVSEHAEKYPLLTDAEIEALAEDIRENGLLDPLTVTADGVLLDGRNRLKACELAGVEPEFVTYDGPAELIGAFIRGKNRRRHQPTGSRAMSEALSLQLDGKRKNGRWAYGALASDDSGNPPNSTWVRAVRDAGVVLDFKPDLADPVVSGELALDNACQQAIKARDAERDRLEREERLKAEEADAKQFITTEAPDLAKRVDGKDLQSFVEALDLWKRRNREEAERIRREKEREKRLREEREKSLRDMFTGIAEAVTTCANYGKYDDMTAVVQEYRRDLLYPPQLDKAFTPEELKAANRFITFLIDWSTK